MRKCASYCCDGVTVQKQHVFCPACWALLPTVDRRRVIDSWGSPRWLREIERAAEVLADLEAAA